MKLPVIVLTAALLSFAANAEVQTDCHQSLKDMLEGTLEHEGEINNSQTDTSPDAPDGCTLAERPGAPPAFTATLVAMALNTVGEP